MPAISEGKTIFCGSGWIASQAIASLVVVFGLSAQIIEP
jgi:hypothetical protein